MNEPKEQFALFCKALSHPKRIEILQKLIAESCCNQDIVRCVPLAQATISQHIKILQQAGLLCVEKKQQKHFYCVKLPVLRQFQTLAQQLCEEKTMTTRIHISLKAGDLAESKQFYETLFAQKASKNKPDYLNFRLDTPPIHLALHQSKSNEKPADNTGINHFGIELPDHATLALWRERLNSTDTIIRDDKNTACCYATGDKFWVTDPDQHTWEIWVRTGNLEKNHCESSC